MVMPCLADKVVGWNWKLSSTAVLNGSGEQAS